MKRFAETVSESLGFRGEINETVMLECRRRLDESFCGAIDLDTLEQPLGDKTNDDRHPLDLV